jgi:hypothetical protein
MEPTEVPAAQTTRDHGVPGASRSTNGEPGGTRRRAPFRRGRALLAIAFLGLASATMIQSFSWNQTSHYDLIRSLDQGQTTIDPYRENTGDKVEYPKNSGHWYSARAPGLALFSLPFYDTIKALGAESWTHEHVAPPQHPGDEMIYLIGLWGSVLPGFLLLLLVYGVAERFEPGFGAASAVILGLGTLVLPLSTLLFSHVFTAFLGFAAFWLMLKERDGPPSFTLLALAGLAMGYAFSSEYPTFFVAVVLGGFLLSRRDCLTVPLVTRRAGAYVLGGVIGIIPLLLYNHYAFHSWTHLAYANVQKQQRGFFGIDAPSPRVLATLMLDSRGLLILSPVLIMGAIGTVMLYRRARRAEALTITAICACFLIYNSGYYLPFGGGFMGPRFLTTMLPFLACPVGLALKRLPAPTVALAGASIAITVIATITHPLVGYETETVQWENFLSQELFQPTIASAYGLGRGYGGIWPFLLAAGAGIVLACWATPRVEMSGRMLLIGAGCLLAWGLFAALAPTLLGIDHAGLESIYKAGDHTALSPTLLRQSGHVISDYPLKKIVPICAAAGLLSLGLFALARSRPRRPRRAGSARPRPAAAVSGG